MIDDRQAILAVGTSYAAHLCWLCSRIPIPPIGAEVTLRVASDQQDQYHVRGCVIHRGLALHRDLATGAGWRVSTLIGGFLLSWRRTRRDAAQSVSATIRRRGGTDTMLASAVVAATAQPHRAGGIISP
jgi:hypothetical protein